MHVQWATKIPFEDLNTNQNYGTGQGVYNWTKWANYVITLSHEYSLKLFT